MEEQNQSSEMTLVQASKDCCMQQICVRMKEEAEGRLTLFENFSAFEYAVKNGIFETVAIILNEKQPLCETMIADLSVWLMFYQCPVNVLQFFWQMCSPKDLVFPQDMTLLMLASMGRHFDYVESILNNVLICSDNNNVRSYINGKDACGRSALMYAAKAGAVNILNIIKDKGGDIAYKDRNGKSAFIFAIENGALDCIQWFTEQSGVNINEKDCNGKSVLMYACDSGLVPNVNLILSRGAHVTHVDLNGKSALMCAAQSGIAECIHLLLLRGATVNVLDNSGQTALMYAVKNGCSGCVHVLLENGASAEDQVYDNSTTAIMYAAQSGSLVSIRLLLKHGAFVDDVDTDLRSPIMYASEGGHSDCVQLLLQNDAEITGLDVYEKSALILACESGDLNCVELLLKRQALWYELGFGRKSALMYAIQHGFIECVKLLLEFDANANAVDREGRSVIAHAIDNCHHAIMRDCIELLLKRGAKLHYVYGTDVRCMVTYATQRSESDCLDILLKFSDSINESSSDYSSFRTCKCLSERPCSPTVSSKLAKSDIKMNDNPFHGTEKEDKILDGAEGLKQSMRDSAQITDESATTSSGNLNLIPYNYNASSAIVRNLNPQNLCRHSSVIDNTEIDSMSTSRNTHASHSALDTEEKSGSKSNSEITHPVYAKTTESEDSRVPSLLQAFEEGDAWLAKSILAADGTDISTALAMSRQTLFKLLVLVCKNGSWGCLELLLEHNQVQVNVKDSFRKTPLMYACESRSFRCVETLLRNGADGNAVNGERKTALMIASEEGDASCLNLLLQHYAKSDVKSIAKQKPKALMLTCKKMGRVDCAKLLLENGTGVNSSNHNRTTPLMLACWKGNSQIVTLLLEHGAQVDQIDRNQKCALMYAAEKGRYDCVKVLLEKGANHCRVDESNQTVLMYAIEGGHTGIVRSLILCGADVNAKDSVGKSPLMYSAEQGQTGCMKVLLEAGAEIQATNRKLMSSLMYASEEGKVACLKLLLNRGAIVNETDASLKTPLIRACREGQVQCVQVLLRYGADVNACDQNGMTVMMHAGDSGGVKRMSIVPHKDENTAEGKDFSVKFPHHVASAGCLKLLLASGADLEKKSGENKTALVYSFQNGNASCARLLMEADANETKHALFYACLSGDVDSMLIAAQFGYDFEAISAKYRAAILLVTLERNKIECLKVLLRLQPNYVNISDEFATSLLMYAARNSQAHFIQLLLHLGAHVNATDLYGRSALIHAASSKDCIELLLQAGAEINHQDSDGRSALMFSWVAFTALKTLVSHGANVNSIDLDGRTPLMYACKSVKFGHPSVLLLLENGAKVDAVDFEGRTTLMVACHEGNTVCVEELLKHGAEVNAVDFQSTSALMLACCAVRKPELCVRLLLDSGADVHQCDANKMRAVHYASKGYNVTCLQLLIEQNADCTVADSDGTYPLMYACQYISCIHCVDLLLSQGVDINARNMKEKTALMFASENSIDCVNMLLARGADHEAADIHGMTALMHACQSRHTDIAMALIQSGSNVHVGNIHGKTPLMYACEYGLDELVKDLIGKGVQFDQVDLSGKNAFLYACKSGEYECLSTFLSLGVNIEHKDNLHVSAIMYAAKSNHLCLSLLLQHGAKPVGADLTQKTLLSYVSQGKRSVFCLLEDQISINETAGNSKGKSPLMYAAERGYWENVKFLLENGADINRVDVKGKSVLMYACRSRFSDCLRIILKEHARVLSIAEDKDRKDNEEGKKFRSVLKDGEEDLLKFYLRVTTMPLHSREESLVFEEQSEQEGRNALAMHYNTAEYANLTYRNKIKIILEMSELDSVASLGAVVNRVDSFGNTALLYASELGHLRNMALLIHYGADVNMANSEMKTALMFAVEAVSDAFQCVDYLLEHGADKNLKDRRGRTALDYAFLYDRQIIIRRLEREELNEFEDVAVSE